jgi:uncharacterized membrane protein
MQIIYLALTAIPVLGACDAIWIGLLAKNIYKSQMGSLLTTSPIWLAAIAFYVLYAAALAFFVIHPAIEARSLVRALLTAAFLGLTAYGTYDLVGLATITNWPTALTFIDMAYGMVASMIVAGVVYWFGTVVYGF